MRCTLNPVRSYELNFFKIIYMITLEQLKETQERRDALRRYL